jgi:hypothetical protein
MKNTESRLIPSPFKLNQCRYRQNEPVPPAITVEYMPLLFAPLTYFFFLDIFRKTAKIDG